MKPYLQNKIVDPLLVSVCLLASGFLSIYLGQDCNWDLRNYHFYNAYAFLNDRLTFDIAPAQLQSFHNPLLDLPLFLMITHLPPVFCGFIVGVIQGLNIWLIYKIAYYALADLSETKRRFLSLAAGITGYYGAANISEIGTSFHDNVTSIFVLAGLLLLVAFMQKREGGPLYAAKLRFIVAGISLGLAAGLKLPAAVYSLPFLFALLVIDMPWGERIKTFLLSGLGIGIGVLASAGYWMSTLWKTFQNPFFPYYNNIFRSPYSEFVNFTFKKYLPHGTFQVLFYPFHFLKDGQLVSEGTFTDVRMALCYVLLGLLIFMIFYRWTIRRYGGQVPAARNNDGSKGLRDITIFIILFFVLSYIFWQKMSSIYRFIIPLELLSPVFILLIVRYIFPFEEVFTKITLIVFLLIIATMSPMNWGRPPWTESYFDVRIPALEDMAQSTVIMADNEPLSYIIPFFPKSTRFVSVKSNFMSPSTKSLLQDKIVTTLQNSPHIYLLYKGKSKRDYEGILRKYNLKMDRERLQRVYTKCHDDLFLAPVARIA